MSQRLRGGGNRQRRLFARKSHDWRHTMEEAMPTEQTVFIVDDDPTVRESVAALVGARGVPVQTFGSAEEFLQDFDSTKIGCLVVDVRMTGMTGLELQEQLSAEGSQLPVIVITGYANVPMAVRAMQGGALTFLEKPCADQELWNSVRMALEWEDSQRDRNQQRQEIAAHITELTDGESAVMERMIQGQPNKHIATELDIGLRTVELRRASVLKKLHAESLAELVRMAMIVELVPPLGAD